LRLLRLLLTALHPVAAGRCLPAHRPMRLVSVDLAPRPVSSLSPARVAVRLAAHRARCARSSRVLSARRTAATRHSHPLRVFFPTGHATLVWHLLCTPP